MRRKPGWSPLKFGSFCKQNRLREDELITLRVWLSIDGLNRGFYILARGLMVSIFTPSTRDMAVSLEMTRSACPHSIAAGDTGLNII